MDLNKFNFSPPVDPNNCFELLDSSNSYKHISIVLSALSTLLCIPAFYSIIWFEKFDSDHYRTIINRIVSSMSWNGIVWFILVQNLFTIRFAVGPLPSWICFGQFIAQKVIITNFMMLLNATTFLRYVFVFWLKNPGAFNDEFWHIFINIWVVSFSFVFQLPQAIAPSIGLIDYHVCTGENPTYLLLIPPFNKSYVEIFGIFLQIYVYTKIRIFKKKSQTQIEPLSTAKLWKDNFITNIEKTSISSFISNSISFFLILLGAVIAILRTFKDCLDLQMSSKYLLFYIYDLLLPLICCICLIIAFYQKRVTMFQSICKEFKESFLSWNNDF